MGDVANKCLTRSPKRTGPLRWPPQDRLLEPDPEAFWCFPYFVLVDITLAFDSHGRLLCSWQPYSLQYCSLLSCSLQLAACSIAFDIHSSCLRFACEPLKGKSLMPFFFDPPQPYWYESVSDCSYSATLQELRGDVGEA